MFFFGDDWFMNFVEDEDIVVVGNDFEVLGLERGKMREEVGGVGDLKKNFGWV